MKVKTQVRAGQNTVTITINIAQNSGQDGTATAGGSRDMGDTATATTLR